jgi:LuxR family maltose regulon positive regulatory protein
MDIPSDRQGVPLLKTKLYIPPARPDAQRVPRPHLIERLNRGLHRKLTLVSAPAGFGKTTLLSEWVRCVKRPVAWLSLDPSDGDVVPFWRYVIAALQEIDGSIGETAQVVLDDVQSQQLSSGALLTTLLNEIVALFTSFILVLDDYHAIGELAVHETVGFLLEHQPPQMHLVISTREDPPLPLSRLRARGQMTELRASDLRFTLAEAARFLNQTMKLDLSSEEVTTLETKTEGWITGLQLAALSLREQVGRSGFIQRFAGDDRHVMDYLVDEVLARQPEPVQRFLLQTSILERLSGPLCDAVTGRSDGQVVLDRMERTNLFVIPLDNRRYWYRYHHLFADLLRRRLRQSLPTMTSMSETEVETLHLRASHWYGREGFLAEAVSHALASSDHEYAADLVERYVPVMWDRGETVLVHNWLEALPEDVVRSRPLLCIRRAWSVVVGSPQLAGALEELVEQYLQDAERAWVARSGDIDGLAISGSFLGDLSAIRAFLSLGRGDDPTEVVRRACQALDRIPDHALGPRTALFLALGRAYRALGNERAALEAFADARRVGEAGGSHYAALSAVGDQAMVICLRGQFRQAAKICRDVLRSMVEPSEQAGRPVPAAGPIYVLLGTILVEWGDLEEADRALSRGIEWTKWKRAPNLDIQRIGYEALIRLKWHHGDVAAALDIAKQAEWLGPEGDALATALRARLRLMQAEHDPRCLEPAARWAAERQIELDPEGRGSIEQRTLARLRIAQRRAYGRPDLRPLLASLDGWLQAAEEKGYVWWVIEALVLKAMALQAQGDSAQALSVLERALVLAEPEGVFLAFVGEGMPMAHLLSRVVAQGFLPDYVGRLLAAFEPKARGREALTRTSDPSVASLVEPLSARELQVLQLIAEGLTNREIAQRLFISPKTVKRHASSIYGKLDVHSRTQAAARARTLGILSS